MGRIKTSFIKNLGEELYQKYSDKFSEDFEKNKVILKELIDMKSKKLRNILAGYITNLKKREKLQPS
ncbi:MAG: 30S ribosomal protein S17e [Candidatus Aenigmatarchaeota archaeon]